MICPYYLTKCNSVCKKLNDSIPYSFCNVYSNLQRQEKQIGSGKGLEHDLTNDKLISNRYLE